jgi:threonine/homoserine/homoserine lactone efflux protein
MPNWMTAVDHFTPLKSAGMGVVLSAVNPKNLLLALGAAATIAATNLPGTDQVVAYAVFAVIASIGVVAPVVIFFTMGARAAPILDDVKAWLAHNNAAIMAVLFLVIGAKVLGQGIAG